MDLMRVLQRQLGKHLESGGTQYKAEYIATLLRAIRDTRDRLGMPMATLEEGCYSIRHENRVIDQPWSQSDLDYMIDFALAEQNARLAIKLAKLGAVPSDRFNLLRMKDADDVLRNVRGGPTIRWTDFLLIELATTCRTTVVSALRALDGELPSVLYVLQQPWVSVAALKVLTEMGASFDEVVNGHTPLSWLLNIDEPNLDDVLMYVASQTRNKKWRNAVGIPYWVMLQSEEAERVLVACEFPPTTIEQVMARIHATERVSRNIFG